MAPVRRHGSAAACSPGRRGATSCRSTRRRTRIHGVTLDRPWAVVAAGERSLALRCDFDTRWPWAGHAVQPVELTEAGSGPRIEVHAER